MVKYVITILFNLVNKKIMNIYTLYIYMYNYIYNINKYIYNYYVIYLMIIDMI